MDSCNDARPQHLPIQANATMLRCNSLLILVAVLAASLAGCDSGKKGGSITVSGTVKFNGDPIENGTITFLPADDKGAASSARITNGSYTIQTDPGAKKVSIMAEREVGGEAAEQLRAEGRDGVPTEQYLPPEFNSKTKLEYTVESGGGTKDFELEGREGSSGGPAPRGRGRR
jgi:hypothetical protein